MKSIHPGIFLIGCIFFVLPAATGQVEALFRKSPDERIMWLSANPVWHSKDSIAVTRQLDSVFVTATRNNDLRLAWYAELHKVILAYLLQIDRGGEVTAFEDYREHIESCPVPEVKAAYWFKSGYHCFRHFRFDEALPLLFRSKNEFEKIGFDHIPNNQEYLYGFGEMYYWFEDYANAIKLWEKALSYPNPTRRGEVSLLNSIGMAYQRLGNFKKAEEMFLQCSLRANRYADIIYWGISTGNYGNTLRLQGKNREALPHLYTDFDICQHTVPENAAITALYIAKALMELDSLEKARTYITLSLPLSPAFGWSSYPVNYYEALALYHKKRKEHALQSMYMDSLLYLKDSLKLVFSNKLLTVNENLVSAEKYLNEIESIEKQQENAILVRNLIIGTLLLFFGSVFYVLYLKRQKLIKERQDQKERQKRADDLLARAKVELQQYLGHINDKKEFIEKINQELAQSNNPASNADTNGDARLFNLEALLESVILTEKDWQQFKFLFEQVYPDFFENLKKKYTDLTPAEIRLLALLKLDISTKQIAYMLGVSMETIRKSRYRLRKKLEHIGVSADLEGLIDEL